MADTKISDLTAVTTPASTDEFAVNQGGTSKKQTRAQLHALESGEHLVLPQVNEAATPTLAFGDGDTGMYEAAANDLRIATLGITRFRWSGNKFLGLVANSPGSLNEASTATNPTLVPSGADLDTGIGHQSNDNISLIAGGLEAARIEDPADLGAGETSLWLYDDDNDTVEQVTVGIADSGGAGFKLLRITN